MFHTMAESFSRFDDRSRPRFDERRPQRPFLRSGPGVGRDYQRPTQPKRVRTASSAPEGSDTWETPWVQVKYFSIHPCIYASMVGCASPDARPGQIVSVHDRDGQRFGRALFNPRARVPLRVFYHGQDLVDETYLDNLVAQAVELRCEVLRLPEVTDAFRVIHSDGDGLSGLVIDKFADVLVMEVHSLGMHQRLERWLPILHQRLNTRHARIEMDAEVARLEGMNPISSTQGCPKSVRIQEHGVRYEVQFEPGHKTGFFCDQRENRRRLAEWTRGRRVLDLCCYTGGFGLSAQIRGDASSVTGVDLDEKAVAQARRNANLNQVRIDWTHVDAFSYVRQMHKNQTKWDVVVLDPPKMILSRDTAGEDKRRYEDLNGLAVQLVAPGGFFVTCSCSGLISAEEFEELVIRACHRQGKRLQILDRTGPGPDHPVVSNCPEGRYLKVLWTRVP